jgi:hypothetical protein
LVDLKKIFSSETPLPNEPKLRTKFHQNPLKDVDSRVFKRMLQRTDRNEISHLYRGPSIDAVHLAKLFQSRRCLEIDQSETRIAFGGHVSLTNMAATGNSYF